MILETDDLALGYTESRFPEKLLADFFAGKTFVSLKQTHSASIVETDSCEKGAEGDGILVSRSGIVAIIRTADCVPLFFFVRTPRGEPRAGILHIGWRGLQQGIEKRLLSRLKTEGIAPDEISFLTGPAIGPECYPVGEELAAHFRGRSFFPQVFSDIGGGRYRMDLKEGIRSSLEEDGVPRSWIADAPLCTFCLNDRFPSYRRDGKTGDRIFNFLYLK